MDRNKSNSNKKNNSEKLKKIYEKYYNILDGLKKKQDEIINKHIRKKENKKIEEIRSKLLSKQ